MPFSDERARLQISHRSSSGYAQLLETASTSTPAVAYFLDNSGNPKSAQIMMPIFMPFNSKMDSLSPGSMVSRSELYR